MLSDVIRAGGGLPTRITIGKGRQVLQGAAVVASSLFFGLTFGLHFGVSNHNSYLIHGLQLADPNVLSADWLTGQCTDYHPFFSYVVSVLARLDILAKGLAAANVVVIAVAALAIFGMAKTLSPDRGALTIFLTTLGWMSFDRTRTVASSYAFTFIFQPSTIALGALTVAILFFLRGRYAISGLLLGLGGLFHVNVLVLSLPLFFLSHLFVRGPRLIRRELFEHRELGLQELKTLLGRLVWQLGPASIALLPHLPLLLASSASPDAAEARRILMTLRSPHHYFPERFLSDFLPLAIWSFLGLLCLWATFEKGSSEKGAAYRRLAALYVTLLLMVWGATVLTTLIYIPTVAQLFFWRLAPFVVILAQLLVAIALFRWLWESSPALYGRWLAAAIAGGSLWLLMIEGDKPLSHQRPGHFLVVIAMLSALSCLPGWGRTAKRNVLVFAWPPVLAFLLLAGTAWPFIKHAHRLPPELQGPQRELYDWAAASTDNEALFLIPPALESFRLHARRAVIADWKSPPIKPEEVVEWYRRLQKVTGRSELRAFRDLQVGYQEMDVPRFADLKREFAFDYAVFRKPATVELAPPDQVVFENAVFVVVQASG